MIRRILMLLGTLVLLALIGVVVVWIYLDRIAAAALTRGVEYAGDVKCTVDDVSVSLLSGRIGIKELVIKSPAGYGDGDMFTLGDAKLEVRVGSLWSQPVHVRNLEIVKPLVRMAAGPGGSNVTVFLNNVQRKFGTGEKQPEKQPEKPPTRMWVDKLVIKDATVHIGTAVPGRDLADVQLTEPIELTNVRGKNDQGVTAGELAAMIVLDLVRKAAPMANVKLENLIPKDLTAGLDTWLQTPGSVLEGAKEVIKAPGETILKSILPPKNAPQAQGEKP